jgi:hypothetical protein
MDTITQHTSKLDSGYKLVIKNLDNEIEINNAVNEFRSKNGLVKTRNPFSWWKYVFVAATYADKPVTFKELHETLKTCNVHISRSNSSHLSNAVRGMSPDSSRREYTTGLPWLAKHSGFQMGVKNMNGASNEHQSFQYEYKNATSARLILINVHPDLSYLFAQFDRHLA